jgi:hypothetical protein
MSGLFRTRVRQAVWSCVAGQRSRGRDLRTLRAPGNPGNTVQGWADVESRLIEENKPALKNRWRHSWRTLPVCHAMQGSRPSLRCEGRVPLPQERRLLPCELGAALPTAFLRIGDQARLANASNRDRLGSRVDYGERSPDVS